jgi:hypothetical protein
MPHVDDPDDPELNPLLNPLLSENMSRWAEVYLKSPPDQRVRAVRELVHVLRERDRQRRAAASGGASQPVERHSWPRNAQMRSESTPFADGVWTTRRRPVEIRRSPRNSKRTGSHRTLILAAAVLAAGAGWLGLRAEWVGPAVAPPASAVRVPAPSWDATRSAAPEPGSRIPIVASVSAAGGSEATTSTPGTRPPRAPSPGASGTPKARIEKTGDGGSAELLIAEQYLDGTEGKARDANEAAKWLWEAVAKQNIEATERLADLYLSGEGVPRNCEQARMLLDAAASKDGKRAAAGLRHLRASGCEQADKSGDEPARD